MVQYYLHYDAVKEKQIRFQNHIVVKKGGEQNAFKHFRRC